MLVEFKDLVGDHILNTACIQHSFDDGRGVVEFNMGCKTYTAIEDPDDGYRSYLEGLYIGPLKDLTASIINRKVRATHECSERRDLLTLTDVETGHVWLVIGTEDTDDYYPYCVMQWSAMDPRMAAKESKDG